MREIKFRIYDKKTKQFHYFDLSDTYAKQFFTLKEWTETPKQQYTGLKDKNGVKIYEGDIVTPNGQELGIVKWWEGTFSIDYSQSPAVGKRYYGINAYKYLEVIGNSYEPSELLK